VPQTTPLRRTFVVTTLLLGLCLPAAAQTPSETSAATDDELAERDRIAELERKVEVLAEELERTRTEMAVPDEPPLEGRFGLGPAASRVYGLTQGLSIGGYAEAKYTAFTGGDTQPDDTFDFTRAVLYVGYKFTDKLLFNMEVEVEHADEIFLEFATLDYLWRDELALRGGLLLAPMGFLNEIHEPPFYFGNQRPAVEQRIIPTTWRENGGGIFGSLFGEQLEYRIYAMNGFLAWNGDPVGSPGFKGFDETGLRGGRQKGSKAVANDWSFVGRLDWFPLDGLLLGVSGYAGNSGQEQPGTPDSLTTMFDVHAQYTWRGLWLRGLFTMAFVDQAGALNLAQGRALGDTGVAGEMLGGYGEVAYNVWQWIMPDSNMTLEPFYRFEYVDTQRDIPTGFLRDRTKANWYHTVGLQYKPIPQVALKLDYRNVSALSGDPADEVNMGFGLVF
jgi:hypothetical protein